MSNDIARCILTLAADGLVFAGFLLSPIASARVYKRMPYPSSACGGCCVPRCSGAVRCSLSGSTIAEVKQQKAAISFTDITATYCITKL